jgi:hypothetical protein
MNKKKKEMNLATGWKRDPDRVQKRNKKNSKPKYILAIANPHK